MEGWSFGVMIGETVKQALLPVFEWAQTRVSVSRLEISVDFEVEMDVVVDDVFAEEAKKATGAIYAAKLGAVEIEQDVGGGGVHESSVTKRRQRPGRDVRSRVRCRRR